MPKSNIRTLTFPLSGLSCSGCVNKIKKVLSEINTITFLDVSKTQLTVNADAPIAEISAAISALNYQLGEPKKIDDEKTHTLAPPSLSDSIQKNVRSPETTYTLLLAGMSCASCVKTIEDALNRLEGVKQATVNFAERTALVIGDMEVSLLIETVERAGYQAELALDENQQFEQQAAQQAKLIKHQMRNTYLSLGLGIPLMAWGIFGGSMTIATSADQIGWGVMGFLTFILLITAGRGFFTNAWESAKHGRASMDTLVSLGVAAAWCYSTLVVIFPHWFPEQARHVYFEASAMILGLISLGHAIETKSRASTSDALKHLLDLQPMTAILITNNKEKEIALSAVKADMTLRIKPGAKIPVDGEVIEGESYIDESMLSGEPLAVGKNRGSKVFTGTLNQQGCLLIKVENIGKQTLLSQIIALVKQAQNSKPALARLADKISAVFVPGVIAIAFITAIIWFIFGPEPKYSFMLVTATTVLIIACPCALGLATPMSVTTGIGRAAELGILIRNADVLQLAANINTVVIDKTGTLTQGKPSVTCIHPIGISQNELLTLCASIEHYSEHPLATAIVNEAKERNLPLHPNKQFSAITGKGIEARLQGHQYFVGNEKLMIEKDIELKDVQEAFREATALGETPIFVATKDELIGFISISDPIRSDSTDAISRLQKQGIEVIMLTGDHEDTANAVAKQAGITDVIAQVLPHQKAETIEKLQQEGKTVAMIGDGINDAPALAKANVGIAMGSGNDIAIESAHMALIHHSIHAAIDGIELSKAALKNIKQNLFGAFVYNSLGIPIAAGILYPFTGSLLSPIVAGAAMALSSITVVVNANRLKRFTPRR